MLITKCLKRTTMGDKIAKAYEKSTDLNCGRIIFMLAVLMAVGILFANRYKTSAVQLLRSGSNKRTNGKYIKAVTWNIAAINNNPFEYWITNDDIAYNKIMKSVSSYIDNPESKDIEVKSVFTETMFNELEAVMKSVGWKGTNETRVLWDSDYKNRKIISQFIKDPLLGKKRLVSMPDRVSNTVNTANSDAVYRPTVVNCYPNELNSLGSWWKQWVAYIFKNEIAVKKNGIDKKIKMYEMFQTIKKSKYPSISAEEEAVSIPLQTMCLAIFDAILVHMMNDIDAKNWQKIRSDICLKLNHQKNDRTVDILATTYGHADILFLQEVAGNFPTFAIMKQISKLFHIYQASNMDTERDQNSFILLKKGKYRDVKDVTEDVISFYTEMNQSDNSTSSKLPVVNGDLIAITAVDQRDSTKYLLASFHGDTNGLATIPVVTAVRNYATSKQPDCRLLFGLDANTYTKPEADQLGVTKFAEFYTSNMLNSCYGSTPNPYNFTTFHARTHLQAQLNKVS